MRAGLDTTTPDLPLLRVRGLSKSFPGQRALADVDLDVHAGEIVAVVGQNGSGKSTLVKTLTGVHTADSGGSFSVRVDNATEVEGAAASSKIHVIHQDLGLIGPLTTVENLDLGRQLGRRALRPTRTAAEAHRARELIARFGASFDVLVPVERLAPAERAIVAIARALDGWSRPDQLLLLDEPTAALHGSEVGALFTAIRRAAAGGAGVMFISHRLDEVLDLADRVVALRGGRVIADERADELDRSRLIELIAGHAVDERRVASSRRRGEAVLEVKGLTGPGLDGVDVTVHAGEIVGVCGLLGSGREHLCRAIFGATSRVSGRVAINGQAVGAGRPAEAIARGAAFVPADRRAEGAVMSISARENITLPSLKAVQGRLGLINRRAEDRDVREWVSRVELAPAEPERVMELFSGGNQQKVVLAKWLRNRPRVLLLDEPTQGVDVGAKSAIYRLVRGAADAGAGVLVSSSDTAELSLICDRVIVLRDRRVASAIDGDNATEARLVAESLGIEERTADELFGVEEQHA